ncbi:MAG: pyridoxamine 5'-phosphate oxidase family protein [Gammaproteobacteria bacterium]|nr:pyridoxamine 5'-phosphate oxidase family protein [Gammaproteobacteria bacterium]
MGKKYSGLNDKLIAFIQKQKMYFVATAPVKGRINLSPKGMDTLRVINNNQVAWLNLTGSGNETAAHLLEDTRMTMMFCSFEGNPMILRLYGQACAIHPHDTHWQDWLSHFPPLAGARQVIVLDFDLVHTSCGMAVPCYDFVEQRDLLDTWATKKGGTGIADYWQEKNVESLDGKPTGIIKRGSSEKKSL